MKTRMVIADDWEKSVDYGTHRNCRGCGNATVTTTTYGEKIECSIKKAECRSGIVLPSHSCRCWKGKNNDSQ